MVLNKDKNAIKDILHSIDLINNYLLEVTEQEFYKSQEKQDLTVHRLEVIGEASKRLSSGITDHYKTVPWKEMKGMRDILIHQYDNILLEIVWKTVKERLSQIEKEMIMIMEELDNQ